MHASARRLGALLGLAGAFACGQALTVEEPEEQPPRDDASSPDGSPLVLDGAPVDASVPRRVCDPSKPFGNATKVPVAAGFPINAIAPRLSADELDLYITASVGAAGARQAAFAHRPSLDAPFGLPVPVGVPITDHIVDPAVSDDGLVLVFSFIAPSGGIWLARRPNSVATWDAPRKLRDGPAHQPYYDNRADELWWTEPPDAAGQNVDEDLYRARVTDGGLVSPELVAPPSDTTPTTAEYMPMVTKDGLTLLFSSARGVKNVDLWIATRAKVDAPFEAPVQLGPEVNTDADEISGWISADGCALYFSRGSIHDATLELWIAARP